MPASGAILRFELTANARRARYYFLRGVLAAVLGCVLYVSYLSYIPPSSAQGTASIKASASMAGAFFTAYGFFQLGTVLLLLPALVAPAIAGEKERRTLDDVLGTDLRAWELIFGKFLAGLSTGLTPIIVGFGILGIAILFGGVDPLLVGGLLALTAAAMASAGAAAMLMSCRTQRTRDALTWSYFLIALFYSAPYLVHGAGKAAYFFADRYGLPLGMNERWLDDWNGRLGEWRRFEPFGLYYAHFFENVGTAADLWNDLRRFAAIHVGVALALLPFAALTLRATRRRELDRTKARRGWRLWRPRLWPRLSLAWLPPMLWKELRTTSSAADFWMLLAIAAVSYIPFVAVVNDFWIGRWNPGANTQRDLTTTSGVAMALLALGTWGAVITRAGASIGQERRQDTWVSLLTTGQSANQILGGKLLGSLTPLCNYAVFAAPLFVSAVLIGAPSLYWLSAAAGVTVVLAFCFAAFGLSQSLVRRSNAGAIGVGMGALAFVHGVMQGALLLVGFLLVLALGSSLAGGTTFLGYLLLESIPGALVFVAATWQAPDGLPSADRPMAFYAGVVSLGGYLLAAIVFFVVARREFPSATGRTENRLPRIDAAANTSAVAAVHTRVNDPLPTPTS